MRPVNLIPPEDRRGERAPLRSGPLSYAVVGALAVVLLAVVAMVMTRNDIAESEAQVAQLELDRDAAAQRAASLQPYAEFASLQESRNVTITGLAQSRFDWERVLRELALVIPSDVTLESLNGSATASDEAAGDSAIEGPSLTAEGCAADHDAVARFVAALSDIDGVTRVGLSRSQKSDAEDAGDEACGSANTFALTIAFDNASVLPSAAGAAPAAPAAPAPEESAKPPKNSQEEQTDEVSEAVNLVPGVSR